ncbi:hypothetical protein L228DRAFT_271739 [Xylona heveae TC161]|uniref:Protein kinase domain-containing protein n=1 Tax=Xylona heveae (strain CBS 132557 / TC161) TaxID=1328760 RepID=A0A164Z9A0_XYLHT|nr:hypothetical protein L228DRAFT_271739 [Xylona heveae TC161]KZF18839.1 hypothetical protein L228DRAFT_271739 [Xylona heveae TC161]
MDIKLSEVLFVEELKKSDSGCIFRVRWRGMDCVMKVFHTVVLSFVPPGREVDNFKCESRAYSRLKAKGLCDRGDIPDFYGTIEQIDPMEWQPHLKRFLNDRLRPNAVLIEYIPNMRRIDLSNFTEERARKLRQILTEIHEAGVFHGDLYPRNMMVQEVDHCAGRALWIDFDCAQTLEVGSLTPRQQQWLEEEDELMDEFVDGLVGLTLRFELGYC